MRRKASATADAPEYLFERGQIVSNLKLVAGTVKRRGIAIAAAVAVAGGSLATANYAMAVETGQISELDPTQSEYHHTEAGNEAVRAANAAAHAIRQGASDEDVKKILHDGVKNALGKQGADFTQEDIDAFGEDDLNGLLQATVESGKNAWRAKNGAQSNKPTVPEVPAPQIPSQPQSPAVTPSPAYGKKLSPQRLEAEFGGVELGEAAGESARQVADAIRRGKSKEEVRELIKDRLRAADYSDNDIAAVQDNVLEKIIEDSFAKAKPRSADLDQAKQESLRELEAYTKLNPLQKKIFKDQILAATKTDDIDVVLRAAGDENRNPVAPFAPAPGQETPSEAPDTDVERALDYTKAEALEKLRGLSNLTEQQKAFYEEMVNAAKHVYEVEDAYEAGVAKDKVNDEAKKASGFLAKAIARTKHLALKQLDDMKNLTHEQKKEARNKIVAAKQVFEVEAAFHAAEKLNKAAK